MSGFDEWLRSQINRSDQVGNVAFEAERDPDWPRGAGGPGAVKRYLLEERGIYGQKIFDAVDEAWAQFDKEEVEDWKSDFARVVPYRQVPVSPAITPNSTSCWTCRVR